MASVASGGGPREHATVTLTLNENYRDLFPDACPIFVLGAARSGTSIVGDALRFGAGIPGTREGFLFSTAYLLITNIDALWQKIGPPLQYFADEDRGDAKRERALSRFDFHEYQRHCLRHFHQLASRDGQTWIDKTPDIYMVHAVPILAAAYPKARWIWVQRNGIEVLDSRRRTHPEMTFAEGCNDWAQVVTDWHRVRGLLGDRWIQVDQREVVNDPEAAAARQQEFLGLDEEQRSGIVETYRTKRPGKTMQRDLTAVLTLASAEWPDEQKVQFREICAEAMQAAGYSL